MPEMEETDEDDDSGNSSWDDDEDSDCVEVLDNIMSPLKKNMGQISIVMSSVS